MGLAVDAIYLDFAKAFDTVPHQKLIMKLEGHGVRGKVAQWIQHFLERRCQCVRVNGVKSDWTLVTRRVLPGQHPQSCFVHHLHQ